MKKLIIPIIVFIVIFANFLFVGANINDTNNEEENVVKAESETIIEETLEFDLNTNYAELMVLAACNGDFSSGYEFERLRGLKKQYLNIEDSLTFDDLYLLAKVIESEAGSNWLTEEHRQMVASVVVNRVKSPEFPNTLYEVVYQKGQYAAARTSYFKNLIPSEKSIRSAMTILKDGSIAPANVVFQAEFSQGKGVIKK